MPKLIVKCGYTKNVQHFVNNLEYAGNKINSQQVVLLNGTVKNFDGCKKINFNDIGTENIATIFLTFKDGVTKSISAEAYEKKIEKSQNVTVERIIEEVDDNDTEKKQPRELQELDFFKYMSYVGERPGAVRENGFGLFSLKGDILPSAAEDLAKTDDFKRGWMHIISMSAADAQRTGFDNRAAWRDLAISKAPEIAKAYNISLENLRFYGGFHANTDNPHVHINFYSTDSNEGYVTDLKKASKKVKSLFTNAIFKDDVLEIKEAIGIAKNEMSQALAKVLAMKEVKPEYVTKLKEISYSLPTHGKMQYQFAPAQTKELIKNLLRTLLKDESLEPIFQGYLKGYELYAQLYADNVQVIDRQKTAAAEDLVEATGKNSWRRLHNEIMQAAVKIRDINDEVTLTNNTFNKNEQLPRDSYSKSHLIDNKWNMNVSEKSTNDYAALKKLIYKTFSQSLLEETSTEAQHLKKLLNDKNATLVSILTAAMHSNSDIKPVITALAQELSDKPLNNNNLIMPEAQLLDALLNDEKNSPVLSFSAWCKTAYNQMAAAQVRKHCKRFNSVAGKYTIKKLEDRIVTIEPNLCELYLCNKQINALTENGANVHSLSAEDRNEIELLNAKRKSFISDIYSATFFSDDSFMIKYKKKLEKYSCKYFDQDRLNAINTIIKDDVKNGNTFAAPGTYISSFAQNLPEYYIKQLAGNECKEATTELYKVISNTINEKIVAEPNFAQDMQQCYLELLAGNEIDCESINASIFSDGSQAIMQRQEWLTTMNAGIAEHVPEQIQEHVLKRLKDISASTNRVLPFNNTIYRSIANLPEYYIKQLAGNECKEATTELYKVISNTINEKIVSEPNFAQDMQQCYLELLAGNEIDCESINASIFSDGSQAIMQRQEWLTTMNAGIAEHVPEQIQEHVLKRLEDISASTNRVLPFNNTIYHSIANLPEYYIKQLAGNECKEATTELYKVISSTINEKIVTEPNFAQDMQQCYLELLAGNEIDCESINASIFSDGSQAIMQRQEWLTTMNAGIAEHVPEQIQEHVLKRLEDISASTNRVLPFNNTIYHSIANLPETITNCVLSDNPLFDEFKKTVNHAIVCSIRNGQQPKGDKTISTMLRSLNMSEDNTSTEIKSKLTEVIKGLPEVANAFYALESDFMNAYSSITTIEFPQAEFESAVINDGYQSVGSSVEYYAGKYDALDKFFREERIKDAVLHMFKGIAQGLVSEIGNRQTDLSQPECYLTGQGEFTRKHGSLAPRNTHKRNDLNW